MELKHIASHQGRLSSFLQNEMHMSAGLMNKLKWKDCIRVNGVPQRTDYQVLPGDVVTVCLEEPEPEYPAQDGFLSIIYEDDHILAVDKPAGMLIHPSRAQNENTLANYVYGYYIRTGQKSAFHPMTRLDRDTFGIVLLGKNAHIHTLLQQAAIRKTYHALTFGGPEKETGTINAPIARRPLPSLLREIRDDGKPSVTEFRVLYREAAVSKLALRPITGRTHQLRLHCAHMGFPILGDPQYASEESREFSHGLGLSSQLLCAKRLELVHPMTGLPLLLESHMDAKVNLPVI